MIFLSPHIVLAGTGTIHNRTRAARYALGACTMHQPPHSVIQAFQTWKADLVDLTTDNPLLFFRPDRNSLRLALPPAGELLKQFLAGDSPQHLRLARSAT